MSIDTKVAQSKERKPQAKNLDSALIEGNRQAVARWMETLLALTQEITSFTQHRFQEDMDTLLVFAACRSPAQALEHQQRYFSKASQEYTDEIAKLGRMVTSLGCEGISGVYQPPKAAA
jgi:thioesterase domain-containing protein